MEEAGVSTGGDGPSRPRSFQWNIRNSLNTRFVGTDTPRRFQEDLGHMIRGLSPLVEQSQNISLGAWLRQPRLPAHNSVHTENVDTPSSSTMVTSEPSSSPRREFVVDVDGDTEAGSPSGGVSPAEEQHAHVRPDSSGGLHSEVLRQNPELRAAISVAEKYIPFLIILLTKLVFDHVLGIFVLLGLIITFAHANSVVKREVGKQAKRNLGSLWAITMNLLTCIFFIYYVFEPEKLYYSLAFLSPFTVHPPSFWDLLWVVTITDFIIKLITILFKVTVIALPSGVIASQRKGRHYLFIEQTSQLYRSFTPIHPWVVYLIDSYDGFWKIAGIVLCAVYIVAKVKQLIARIKAWRASLAKLVQCVTYGCIPSKEEIDAIGNMCPICQDHFRQPTMLHCKHIFCEDCVSMWFDRERTCPMCRAQIADDPSWRDGSTTYFLQIF